MTKIISFFWGLCVLFCIGRETLNSQNAAPPFHIFTVASDETIGFKRLKKSCTQYGIEIDVLGMGLPYRGNGQKLTYLKQYIKNLPDTDIVLFVDAYDVLFAANSKTILKTFLEFQSPFVISVERKCYPFSNIASQYPESPTSFRFINSGSFIGYVSAIKKIVEGLEPIVENTSDQGQISLHYLKNKNMYTLDYNCKLFLTLSKMKLTDVQINDDKKTVSLLDPHVTPCIIHGNGTGRPLFRTICSRLYKTK